MGRSICLRCGRPQPACLCAWVRSVENRVPVLVLQHPDEAAHAKGTVRLLGLSLARCEVRVGEVFSAGELGLGPNGDAALLYPDAATSTGPDAASLIVRAPARLVVLDGTWRKAHRLLCQNPWLAELPRFSLAPAMASRYKIRRARRADQLSTLEATCLALCEIDGDSARYGPLLQALDGFVDAIAQRMPVPAGRADAASPQAGDASCQTPPTCS